MSSSEIIHYLAATATGAVFIVVTQTWRQLSKRWQHWMPLFKKAVSFALSATGVVSVLVALYLLVDSPDATKSALALVAGAGLALALKSRRVSSQVGVEESVKRGARIQSAAVVRQQVKAKRKPVRLELAGVPIPVEAEPYHFLVCGATGTGKSVAINQVLSQLRNSTDTVIVVDSGGDFLSNHFREETDFVFNPFDARCVNWSPLFEMKGSWDAEGLARSIIPDGHGDSKDWNHYAQTLVSSVLRQLFALKKTSLQDFLYYTLQAPLPELRELLAGTPAAGQMSSEKTFASIRSIAANYLNPYISLPLKGEAFSITEMVQAEHSGFLFLTYRDDQLDSLKSLIACMLDVAARAILSLPPDPNRRVWLIIDEFASIGKVQSVENLATKARKAGGCLLIGLQSVSQLRDRYGENGAQTILSCLSSWLVLRSSDTETAEYMSRYIGEVELIKKTRSVSIGDSGDSNTQSEQHTTQRVVLASELQALANLKGYLKLAGGYPLCSVSLDVKSVQHLQASTPRFVARAMEEAPPLRRPLQASDAKGLREGARLEPAKQQRPNVVTGTTLEAAPLRDTFTLLSRHEKS
jgi:hypothetical protein